MTKMFQPDSYLTTLFYRLREDGFNLSIREYFSAKDAIEEGWGTKNKEDFLSYIQYETSILALIALRRDVISLFIRN